MGGGGCAGLEEVAVLGSSGVLGAPRCIPGSVHNRGREASCGGELLAASVELVGGAVWDDPARGGFGSAAGGVFRRMSRGPPQAVFVVSGTNPSEERLRPPGGCVRQAGDKRFEAGPGDGGSRCPKLARGT